MQELVNLLEAIADDIDFHGSVQDCDEQTMRQKADEYFVKFKDFYARIDRHRYSDISKFIDGQLQDTVDSLRDNVKAIIKCAEANGYCDENSTSENFICYKKLNKLYDHIELEVARYSSVKKIQLVAEEQGIKEQKVNTLLNNAKQAVEEAQNQAKNLSQQLISILGIFAGIIVTFSFATTVVGETIANLAKSDLIYLCFVICVLGLVFLNLLAFLMSFITKLSGHKFASTFPWLVCLLSNAVAVGLTIFLYLKM